MAKKATVREVARLAGVSVGTVSNFLNKTKSIASETEGRIEAAIEQLGYIPNAGVRVMLGGRSHALAFLIPDSGNPFLAEVARGIEDVAISAGLVVVVCNTDGSTQREAHYARVLSEMRVAGAIAMAVSAGENALRRLESSGARVVVLGEQVGSGFAAIDLENAYGGYIAMRHLLDLGHTNVLFIGGPGAGPQLDDRYRGARRACTERGLSAEMPIQINADGNTTQARSTVAAEALRRYPEMTAALCANDLIALALRSVAVDAGLRIPEDLAIVGYDDIEQADSSPVPLTTVRLPQYELGVAAAKLVVALADDSGSPPAPPRFTPELVVRASTQG